METNTLSRQEVLSTMIAEKIWGHRFKNGQRGAEYTLEFLNVIAGTEYQLGASSYVRKRMQEFRQFVFEGEKEGREVKQQAQYVSFDVEKKKEIAARLKISLSDLSDIQYFFKNLKVDIRQLDGSKVNRSWYAQFLFPLNESMLFFELRNKKKKDISYERNFFSRGGELYYLALSYGTKHNPILKKSLEDQLKKLLSSNQNIGKIINQICKVLGESSNFEKSNDTYPLQAEKKDSSELNKHYPKLAVTDSSLYEKFAEELNAFLSVKQDIHESFRTLTSLICIQLFTYMITRCESIVDESGLMLVDCTDGQEPHIRRIAQKSYKKHQQVVIKAFDYYSEENIAHLLSPHEAKIKINEWKQAAKTKISSETNFLKRYEKFFKDTEYSKLGEKNKKSLILALENPDEEKAYRLLLIQMKELAREKYQKEELSIINTLGRDGGFITMGRGIQARYTISDTLLNALVLALLNNERKMSFDTFKCELYNRYHIVIGVKEAQQSGICQKERINLGCFKENEKKFRIKLKKNGLLEEFSDATAFIVNPTYVNGGA